MEGSTSCAPRFSSLSEEEKAALIEKVTPQSTKSATKFWVRVVCDFAREKGIPLDFATIDEGQLARLLEDFYCSLRRKDGSEYKRSSYLAARGAVQRELNRLERTINIQSPAFARANKLLDATLKEKKREGREPAVTHKDNISDLDWQQLHSYFSDVLTTLDIKKLAYYVWFNTTLHFCLRGNEAQTKLKKTDLLFTTIEGERAIVLNADFLSKNHQGGVAGSSSETKGAITKPEMVATFERYISKLHPELDRLFQRAKYGEGVLKEDSPVWFMNQPLGHNTLAKMMKNLSEAAKLSSVYTNHCVRVTSIVNMKEAGAEDRKICAISGHRNIQSLQAYNRPTHRDVQALSIAIDKENGPPRSFSFTRTAAMSDEMSASRKAMSSSSGSPLPSMVSAVGSQWHNVTINIAPPAEKRKARLSLKLKKKIQDADKPDSENVS